MRPAFCALFLMLALAACRQAEPAQGSATASPPPAPPAAPSAAASAEAEAGSPRKVSVKNNFFEFEYAYPAAAGAIPALRAELDAELDREQARLASEAREARADAQKEGFPFNPHSLFIVWDVVTDIPGWLSLSGAVESYAGGAHPNHGFEALLWDKTAGRRRPASDLFVSKQALAKVLSADFCAELDRQRAEKRGEPVDRSNGDEFSRCLDPTESALILGSADRQHFTRIGVLIGPYEAGPYVEGDYEVTLPVTAEVLKVVRPEYRQYFATAR